MNNTTLATVCFVVAGTALVGCREETAVSSKTANPSYNPAICQQLISDSLAEQFFPGAKRSVLGNKIASNAVSCTILFENANDASLLPVRVEFQCGPEVVNADALTRARQSEALSGKEITGLGALAYDHGYGQIRFWDDNSFCSASLFWSGATTEKSMAFMKAIDQALTVSSMGHSGSQSTPASK